MHLGPADAVACDHRNTSPFGARGPDLTALLLEVYGSDQRLNRGMAGHMHLMDPAARISGDGIVGSSAPLAVGQAMAAQRLRPGSVAVAFHGEGSMNQGMLMEAYNLADAWRLPVVFVCRDNGWSITTRTSEVTSANPRARARSFGLAVETARGHDVQSVHAAASRLVDRARAGKGPGFLHATVHRPGGHFEGDPLVRLMRQPIGQARELVPGLWSAYGENAETNQVRRARGAAVLSGRITKAAGSWGAGLRKDPLRLARSALSREDAVEIETSERAFVDEADAKARAAVEGVAR